MNYGQKKAVVSMNIKAWKNEFMKKLKVSSYCTDPFNLEF